MRCAGCSIRPPGTLLIISNGLVPSGAGLELHAAISPWRKALLGQKKQWFSCVDKILLEWYSGIIKLSSATLIAAQCDNIPERTRQCWVATPYHALVGHNAIRVLPECQFSWTPKDASQLCKTVNPLLADEGMQLISAGAAMLLVCDTPLQAYPPGFGEISGKKLPASHCSGEDGGRLSRLLSELQMLLFQHPLSERHDRGDPDISGIWFWAPTDWPLPSPADKNPRKTGVVTRNSLLQSLVDGRDAKLLITEAERLPELMQQSAPLPKKTILAGEGYAVVLTTSLLPGFGKALRRPKSTKPESELLALIHKFCGLACRCE